MDSRPNIIFIFIDDMGCMDIGCAGSSFYETPHIDRLRRRGMLFDQAYAACPVCSPSRASALTGRYPARVGVTDWIDMSGSCHPCRGPLVDAPYCKHLPPGERTVANYLQEAGYATWHVGKWHLGGPDYYPQRFGFEVNHGGCHWGHPYKGYFSPYQIETLAEGPEGEFLTDRLTDEAIKLLEAEQERPFFLNLWHYAVHTPIQAKQEDIDYFADMARRLGLDKQQAILEGELFTTQHKRGMRVQRRVLQSDPVYAALIYNLDWNVGRLMEALGRTGKLENTLVVFTSDNGGLSSAEGSPTCNAPAREGKGWTYEGGLRVPMVAAWPGHIAPESHCHTPVTTPDLFCTFLEAAEVQPDPSIKLDGTSLLPLLAGKTLAQRPIFWHYPHYGNQGGTPGAAVRLGDYKLVHFFEDGRNELFDLERDPEEKRELAMEQPDKVRELLALLEAWQEDVCALYPQINPGYTGRE